MNFPTCRQFIFLLVLASAGSVSAQTASAGYPLDPSVDYSGQPCVYFTKPPVTDEGTKMNSYAEGSVVMYGTRTYKCRSGARVWDKIADKPVPEYVGENGTGSAWATDIEGTGASSGQGPGVSSGEGSGGSSASGSGGAASVPGSSGASGSGNGSGANPAPSGSSGSSSGSMGGSGASNSISAPAESSSTASTSASSTGSVGATTPGSPPAGGSPTSESGGGQSNGLSPEAQAEACARTLNSLPAVSFSGNQCDDNRMMLANFNRILDVIAKTCPNDPTSQELADFVKTQKSTAESTIAALCL